jgi:hypothetical protein
MFKTVCRNSYGLQERDPVHVEAFHAAVRETRWTLGRWGWWSYGGSEEQILSDLISDEIEYMTLGKIYSKISGPWMVRNAARNQVLKIVDGLVMAAVTPAWAAMSKVVKEARPILEPKIKPLVEPVALAKKKVVDTITEKSLDIINPLLEKHVAPHLAKIVSIITSPVREAYDESYKIFDKHMKEFAETVDLKTLAPAFDKLNWVGRNWWEMRAARDKLDVMYDPLWLLHEIFTDIYPWSMIWKAHDEFSQKMDNAFYTFEVKLEKELAKNPGADKSIIEPLKAKIMKKYVHDAEIHTLEFYRYIIKCIVMPPFQATVIPACKMILEPIADTIPDPVKEFIDIMEMFDQVVDGIVDGAIDTVLQAGMAK